jgi:predicted NUDIX family NTP pyrophosphohydrolase
LPGGELLELGALRQPGGKRVLAWAFEADLDPDAIVSNTFRLEWPRGSGTIRELPKLDRAGWFGLPAARRKLLKGQVEFLDRLLSVVRERGTAFASEEAGGTAWKIALSDKSAGGYRVVAFQGT